MFTAVQLAAAANTAGTTAATQQDTMGSIIYMLCSFGVLILVFYFFMIRPQKKKEKADRQLRASLQPGDTIVTIGGFTGRILTIKDDEVTFETGAAKTRLTVKKWAIQTREGPEVQAPAEEPAETAQEENK